MTLLKNNCTALSRFLLPWALAWALASHVPASQAERADRNQPVHLEAAKVSIDDANQISTFQGNVVLTQGTMTLRGDKMIVIQSKDGLQHGTVTGQPASFRQKREGLDEYVEGYGARIEYDSVNSTVDFLGQARMKRGQDEVRGEHITYNSRTEVFQAHSISDQVTGSNSKSRVQVVIQPKGETGPAAPVDSLPPADPAPAINQPGNKP